MRTEANEQLAGEVQELELQLRRRPRDEMSRIRLVSLYIALSRHSDALRALTVLTSSPAAGTKARGLAWTGHTHLAAGSPQLAVRNLTGALNLLQQGVRDPDLQAWTLIALARAYQASERRQEAVSAFQQVLAIEPDQMVGAHRGLTELSADLNLKMSRPTNFRLPDINEVFSFPSGWVDCSCRIRIFRRNGAPTVIVVTGNELLYANSQVATNAEALAAAVERAYRLNATAATWAWQHEREENDGSGAQSLCGLRFSRNGRNGDTFNVEFEHRYGFAELESDVGYRLFWRG